MSVVNSTYKQKLRNASSTSQGIENPDIPASPDTPTKTVIEPDEKETVDQEPKSVDGPDTSILGKESVPQKQIVEIPVVNMEDFKAVDANDKLNLIMAAINKINTNFHYKIDALNTKLSNEKDGITPCLTKLEDAYEEYSALVDDLEGRIPTYTELNDRIAALEKNNSALSDELAVLKGLAQVHDKQITSTKDKVVDLTARSMANNITISGILGDSKEENCKQKVMDFFRDTVKVPDLQQNDVEVAHRMGKLLDTATKPRLMVVRCKFELRERIFSYTKNLKDVTNASGDGFYVKPQLPEPLLTQKRERDERFRSIQKANYLIPEEEKHRRVPVQIKNKTLFINKVPQKHHIFPPTVQDMFNIDIEMDKKMAELKFVHSSTIKEKHSSFTGHAVNVKNSGDIKLAYKKLRLLYPKCDHVILGYAIKNHTGYHDHGEYGAGQKVMNCITQRGHSNTAVFVTREYGGIQLGPRRFLYIERAARDALNELYAV